MTKGDAEWLTGMKGNLVTKHQGNAHPNQNLMLSHIYVVSCYRKATNTRNESSNCWWVMEKDHSRSAVSFWLWCVPGSRPRCCWALDARWERPALLRSQQGFRDVERAPLSQICYLHSQHACGCPINIDVPNGEILQTIFTHCSCPSDLRTLNVPRIVSSWPLKGFQPEHNVLFSARQIITLG